MSSGPPYCLPAVFLAGLLGPKAGKIALGRWSEDRDSGRRTGQSNFYPKDASFRRVPCLRLPQVCTSGVPPFETVSQCHCEGAPGDEAIS